MGIIQGEENFFGLDMGTSGVRVVQLKNTRGKPSLLTYGDIETPPNLIASDAPTDQEKMAELVRKIADDAGVSTKNVVTALPTSSVFATTIKTPRLTEQELAGSIHLQADKYIPMPIDQVKLDWIVLDEPVHDQKEAPSEMNVFVVAAPNSIANKYLNIVQKAGFEILALEISPLAQIRSLTSPTSTGAQVIIDFGSSATDITVTFGNKPQLIRSINVGTTALIRSAAQNLGLDETQAGQFLQRFGMTQEKLEGQVFKSVKPMVDTIIDETNKSIKFYQNSAPNVQIEKIIITGGMTTLPEFPMNLANGTGITVEIGNPWLNVSYPANLQDKLSAISVHYSAAIGLAMRQED